MRGSSCDAHLMHSHDTQVKSTLRKYKKNNKKKKYIFYKKRKKMDFSQLNK